MDHGSSNRVEGPEALRASFGDRKLDISRKITACVACRKQKIKCHISDAGLPCTRCKQRGLSCTVNRSLQALLEDDASWKQTVTRKIHAIEALLDTVCGRLAIPQDHNDTSAPVNTEHSGPGNHTEPDDSSAQPTSEGHSRGWQVRVNIEDGPPTIPASCLDAANEQPSPIDRPSKLDDLVSDGAISLGQAEALFSVYSERLDHYLYRILSRSCSLASVRSGSPLLLAAICTVASLHSRDLRFVFDRCYDRFVRLASRMSMANGANLDDIRALCIGAFWLHDLSWNLVSIAVRAATQIHLHQAFQKAVEGDRTAYSQARLWYHVYICDHHLSIPYGRPPMVSEGEAIRSAPNLLTSRLSEGDDRRLLSQVQIWALGSRVLSEFGFNVDVPIPIESIPRLRKFMLELDTWRAGWEEQFALNPYVGDYPRKGVGLHYHFAKLYLCSHAFRGLASRHKADDTTRGAAMSEFGRREQSSTSTIQPRAQLHPELEEIGAISTYSAKSILKTIIGDPEIQAHLDGLSLYFDTMIIFAIVFLIKVATQYGHVVSIDMEETLNLVGEVSGVLNSITGDMHRQHLLVAIAQGVESLVKRCRKNLETLPGPTEMRNSGQVTSSAVQNFVTGDQGGDGGPQMTNEDLGFHWTSFDFLSNQNDLFNDDTWLLSTDTLGASQPFL
ncbi:hypothetical protein GQ53DRAFT_880958 [Thozetella sp. PMI_491]|nr:hypothetical protein GQ53DRAFT_880958 [Thozetella sp. PMI_491]